jgi:hypothetical protein
MNRKTVKYVGFYDFPNSDIKRVSNLAATNKMDYICTAIVRAGYNVEIISPSWIGDNGESKFQRQSTVKVDDNISVTFCPSWQTNNKISRNIKIVFSLTWLFLYLLFNAKKNEKVLAYHVQWISIPIRMAKFFKRYELILEVEEIYCEVWNTKSYLSKMEKKIINAADKYIVASDILKERLNKKSCIVLYGGYLNNINVFSKKRSDKVELIYAGSIDGTKGGAYNAVEAMHYLPNNYRLSVLGFGNHHDIVKLNNLLDKLSQNAKSCTYSGIKIGSDYSQYLINCDIALNPQYQGDYMNTAFPSKILSYLSHNLRVVSTRIKSVEMSSLSSLITFSNDDSPQSIAQAVMSIDINQPYDSKTKIIELDNEFIIDLKRILEN